MHRTRWKENRGWERSARSPQSSDDAARCRYPSRGRAGFCRAPVSSSAAIRRAEELREYRLCCHLDLLLSIRTPTKPHEPRIRRLDSPPLPSPCVLPESIFQRRIGDGSSVVGDRRGCHYGDNLQDLFLREAGSDERIKFRLAQVAAFLNERLRQGGKRSKSLVRRYAPLTNCGRSLQN